MHKRTLPRLFDDNYEKKKLVIKEKKMYVLIEMLKMKNMYERISHVELTFVFIFVRTKIYGQIVQFYITARSNPFFPPFPREKYRARARCSHKIHRSIVFHCV